MAWDRYNDNDEYYVPIKTISGRIIFKPNILGLEGSMAIGNLTYQCNAFLQPSHLASIALPFTRRANLLILNNFMDYIDMISHNSDDRSINLADPVILAAETSQKDNLHLGEATKVNNCEDLMKSMEKEIKYLTAEDVWEILPKSSLPNSANIIRLIWSFKRKRKPIWRANQTQGLFICTLWYATRRDWFSQHGCTCCKLFDC